MGNGIDAPEMLAGEAQRASATGLETSRTLLFALIAGGNVFAFWRAAGAAIPYLTVGRAAGVGVPASMRGHEPVVAVNRHRYGPMHPVYKLWAITYP